MRALSVALQADRLLAIQAEVPKVQTSPALLDYVQDLLEASRAQHAMGLSPRAGLALLRASQAWAMMSGREMVLPEDVQAVATSVMAHRLETGGGEGQLAGRALVRELLATVSVP